MIDNEPSKSIRPIANVKAVVYEDIQCFSYKMRMGQFLSQPMKDEERPL